MIKIKEAVIVEGKYDKIKVASILDAPIITTDGFQIFKDKEKQKLIRRLAQTRGILILTDSDSAGFMIRSFLEGIVSKAYIKNVYIPDLFGKEKRKEKQSAEGKLGVEGVSRQVILDALDKAGVLCADEQKAPNPITKSDLYEDGFIGRVESKEKRKRLLKKLDLPERMSSNALLDMMNIFISREAYKEMVSELNKEMEK